MKNTLRNLLFLTIGTAYFWFYNQPYYKAFSSSLKQNILYGDIILSYITALIIAFAFLGGTNLLLKYLYYFFHNIFVKQKKALFVFDFIVKFISVTKYVIAFYTFSYFAELPVWIKEMANKIYSILILIIFLFFLTGFVNKFFQDDLIAKSKLKKISKNLLPFINKIIIAFIWVVWAITIIGNLWYDITALVAWAWIWGLAIAFAAQKSIANIFGAITILLNKPFNIWDFITVNGITGVVKDIGLSYLTLMDKWWHQVMIPNEVIISTNVENYSVRENRRTDFWIWLVYGTSLTQMEKGVKIIEDILQQHVDQNTLATYRVNFDMFWDFSLNIHITYFSLVNDDYKAYLKQKEEINLEIKKRFKTAKLEMAFPTQELILKKEG